MFYNFLINLVLVIPCASFVRNRHIMLVLIFAFTVNPIFVAIGGYNSAVYLFDFYPLLLLVLRGNLRFQIREFRKFHLLGVTVLGVLPVVYSTILYDRMDFLYCIINLYRLVGVIMVASMFIRLKPRDASQVCVFIFTYLFVFFVLTALQEFNKIDVNTFVECSDDEMLAYSSKEHIKAWIFGLFRTTQGVFCVYSSLLLILVDRSFVRRISAVLLSFAVIAIIGAKTAFVALVFVVVFYFLKKGEMLLEKIIFTFVLFVVGFLGLYYVRNDISEFMKYHAVSVDSISTFNGRIHIWEVVLRFLGDHWTVYFGIRPSDVSIDSRPHFFHNEYLGVLFNGGVFGLLIYGMYLMNLVRRSRSHDLFGILTLLVVGMMHGFTNSFLQPGHLFLLPVFMFYMAFFMLISGVRNENTIYNSSCV